MLKLAPCSLQKSPFNPVFYGAHPNRDVSEEECDLIDSKIGYVTYDEKGKRQKVSLFAERQRRRGRGGAPVARRAGRWRGEGGAGAVARRGCYIWSVSSI